MYCLYLQFIPSVRYSLHTLFWHRHTHMKFPPPGPQFKVQGTCSRICPGVRGGTESQNHNLFIGLNPSPPCIRLRFPCELLCVVYDRRPKSKKRKKLALKRIKNHLELLDWIRLRSGAGSYSSKSKSTKLIPRYSCL